MTSSTGTKSLFAAIVGRPNVGKSSLLNALIGEKLAIVTSKPQTTRTRITGVLTRGQTQFVFLDTPGIHQPRTKLGKRMVKTVEETVDDGDVTLMVFEPYGELTEAEADLVREIRASRTPAFAVINKTDCLKKDADLQTRVQFLEALGAFQKILGVSAAKREGLDALLDLLEGCAAPGPHYFPDDAYTDLPEKAIVAELVREKLLLYLRDELPHGTAVSVERFHEREDGGLIDIEVTIFCEKKSHKGMVIGKGGAMLKKIASAARADCEDFLGQRVNLQCWVKVKDDWRDNDFYLNNFGFRQ
ncbi:GTPase Era [Anaerofilum sp. BX8]|uniref:GTPase Era n=1 Tax=Anaerofilum hominis TaxID=2763016 RepID=A0A923IB41_9FIRM|nr:GTPase Era [Anaerofilum hominis]MBC5582191.1 GTPase Era [Anaerofilum hominis]